MLFISADSRRGCPRYIFFLMKNIIFALFAFAQVHSFGQVGFNKVSVFDFDGAGFSNVLYDDGYILLYGLAKQTDYPWGIFLAKLDTNGNVIWKKVHTDTLGEDFAYIGNLGFIKLKDNSGYALINSIFGPIDALLMIVDNKGNIVLSKEYLDISSTTDSYRKIIELDSGFLIGGDKQPKANPNDHQIFVMRTDKQGNKVWEKWFGLESRVDVLSSLMKVDDNEFVISWSSVNFYAPANEWTPATKMIAIDTLGNVKWEQPFFFDEDGGIGLQKTGDGGWIYTTVRIITDGLNWGDWVSQAKLVRRDSSFNLMWEKEVGEPTSMYNYFLDLKPAPEGGYIGAGSYQESLAVYPDAYPTGWMCRWSEQGDSLWSRKDKGLDIPNGYSESHLAAVAPLPSGSFIACGYSDGPNNSWAWLIKVTRDGCIDTLLCMPSEVRPEPETNDGPVRVYPNPASEQVSFSFHFPAVAGKVSLRVIDLNGKTVHLWPALPAFGEAVWITQNIPSGLYYYCLATADGTVFRSGRVVVSH